MTFSDTPQSSVIQSSFEHTARTVSARLRTAVANLLDACPGEINRATDLQRILDLDPRQAWKLYRVAHEPDPISQSVLLPGRAGMQRILQAVRRKRVPEERLAAVESALDEYEKVVKQHAGDRHTFNSMVAGLSESSKDASQLNLEHRRATFRGNTHLWGIRVENKVSAIVMHPGSEPGAYDFAAITSSFGLTLLRRRSSLTIASISAEAHKTASSNHKDNVLLSNPEPFISSSDPVSPSPLLEQFCSKPLPKTRVYQCDDHWKTDLIELGIGKTTTIDYVMGQIWRDIWKPDEGDHPDRRWKRGMPVTFPTVLAVCDVLAPEGLFATLKPPRIVTYGNPQGIDAAVLRREEDIISTSETSNHLGQGTSVARVAEVPQYVEILNYACEQLGWDPNVFHVYRTRVEYPILHSAIDMQFDLPVKPGAPEQSSAD